MPRSPLGRRVPAAGLAALVLSAPLALLTATPAAAAQPAQITVVHGVRGLVADVRLDGELVLSGFAPERVTDALAVRAGEHRVQAWPTGAGQDTEPVVDETLEVAAGQRATAAIGLDAQGRPDITLYDDEDLLPDEGDTALVVRGLAQSDPVKVVAGDRTVADALQSSQEGIAQVEPGSYAVSAVSASGEMLVPSQDVPVAAGRAVVLYLVGSQRDSTLGWVAQTIRPDAAAAPRRVDTGVGPLPSRAPGAGLPAGLLLVVPAGAVALVAARRRALR